MMIYPNANQNKISILLNRALGESSFTVYHIAIYTALLAEYLLNEKEGSFRISRRRIMDLSQVRSISTYHRCIKDLKSKNFITYNPSHHPQLGTEIGFIYSNL